MPENITLDINSLLGLCLCLIGVFAFGYLKVKSLLKMLKDDLLSDQKAILLELRKDMDMNTKMTFSILEHEATGNHVNNMKELCKEYKNYILTK